MPKTKNRQSGKKQSKQEEEFSFSLDDILFLKESDIISREEAREMLGFDILFDVNETKLGLNYQPANGTTTTTNGKPISDGVQVGD